MKDTMTLYDTSNSSLVTMSRLDQFKTQHELARNFYDDYEFCPVASSDEASEHRQRIQQRISPHSSPSTSPPSTRAIPIINPSNMTPVTVPTKPTQRSRSTSPPPLALNNHQWSTALPMTGRHHHRSIIPIVNPATGQVLQHQQPSSSSNNLAAGGLYDVSVR